MKKYDSASIRGIDLCQLNDSGCNKYQQLFAGIFILFCFKEPAEDRYLS